VIRVSLEAPEVMALESPSETEELVDKIILKDNLKKAIDEALTTREAEVIRMRFGLNENGKQYNLEETGNEFGVTRERIRQIEAEAIRKLKHPSRKMNLEGFL
jgi:RNA polymerase primary sigma factor